MASADVDMQATTRVKDEEEMDVDDEEDEMMSAEDEDDADDLPTKAQLNDERIYSLDILKLVKEAQQARGLRHGDYTRYRYIPVFSYSTMSEPRCLSRHKLAGQ